MDREAQISRRRAIMIILSLIAIFVIAVIGLVIMGIRSGKLASEKVLRSDFAAKVKARESMNCVVSWHPIEDGSCSDSSPKPLNLSMTFAMDKSGERFYLDRYDYYGTYASIYADGDDVYLWSAIPLLASRSEITDEEFAARRIGNVKLTREQFDKAIPDFFDKLDDFIKNVEPGAEIQCGAGGASSYSEPKDVKDWNNKNEE